MFSNTLGSLEEDAKLNAMQRAWQSRKGISSSIFGEIPGTEDILGLNQVISKNFILF